ncbi:MAG: iron-sulfur cluster assembly protein [Rubricoccaceae bacterium]|nr:iron-sulfur cluster assembly protein [Rubricoccaceae bacterium]
MSTDKAPIASGGLPYPLSSDMTSRDFLIDGRDQDFSEIEEAMLHVVKTIYDPEIPVPIWDLGLIYGWDIEETENGADVTVRMTLTAPNCPAAETLPAEVEQGINALEGIHTVKLDLVFTPTYSLEMMSEEARLTLGFM